MPLKSKSLLASLVLRISIVSIVSIAVLSGLVYTQIDRTLMSLRNQTVEEQAKNIAGYLETNKGINKIYLDLPAEIRRFYARAGDADQYLIRDDAGNHLFTSPGAFTDYFPDDLSPAGNKEFEFIGPSGRKFLGLTMPVTLKNKTIYVQAVQTADAADAFSDEITEVFINRLLWVGIPFYLGLLIVIIWTLKGGLSPLHRAAEEVGRMTIADLSLRIKDDDAPREVLPLIRSLNSSFDRLERSIQEQKELAEDVAHELRTPLTILKTRIDMLEHSEQSEKLSRDVDAMIKQVNQMLDVTRLEYADAMKKSDVDLAEVLSRACQDFFPLFIKARRELRVNGVEHSVYCKGNQDLIYRAICNLLDNALEYSPAKTPVEASLKNHSIEITDYGNKIPEEKREAIFERFHKDKPASSRKPGAGLGLSIVARTMEIHGGHADLEKTDEIRNTFRMNFRRLAS
jgi:signal transduction histidine kinase